MKMGIICFLCLISICNGISQDLIIGPSQIEDVTVGTLKKTSGNEKIRDIIASAWTSGGTNYWERTYLKINLDSIDTTRQIDSAILMLYGSPSPANPQLSTGQNKFHIKRVVNSWGTSTINWNNQPKYVDSNAITLGPTTAKRQNMSVNMTDLIIDQLTKPWVSHGYVVHLDVETKYRTILFCSTNYPTDSLRPRLYIYYDSSSAAIPNVSIKRIRTTANTNGISSYNGKKVRTSGTVNTNVNFGSTTIETYLQSEEWGIKLEMNGFSYSPKLGDSIEVIGEITSKNGMDVLHKIDSFKVISSSRNVPSRTIAELDEQSEGHLVKLENLEVLDSTEWKSSGAFVAGISNGTDQFTVRILGASGVDKSHCPKGLFDLYGIGSQADTTIPFGSNYEIIPRSPKDIIPKPYDISIEELRRFDSNGISLYAGKTVKTTGVVNNEVNLSGFTGLQISVQDGDWAATVIGKGTDYGYSPTIGDSLEITGIAKTENGLTSIQKISSIKLKGTANLSSIRSVTQLDERSESALVRLSNFWLVDTTQWGDRSKTFKVQITNGKDTVYAKINKETNVGSLSTTSLRFDMIGIGDQEDATTPYTGSYGIVPLKKTDIIPLEKSLSIEQLNKKNSDGSLKNELDLIRTRGVINSSTAFRENGYKISIQHDAWGIQLYDSLNGYSLSDLRSGDSIEVRGTLEQKFGEPLIAQISQLKIIGKVNPPTIRKSMLLDEGMESVLSKLSNCRILDTNQWKTSGTFFVAVANDNDTFNLKIYGNTDILSNGFPGSKFNVIGIPGQYDLLKPYNSGYYLAPRSYADFELIVSSPEGPISMDGLDVFPNPASNTLTIIGHELNNEISLFDATGRLWFQQTARSNKEVIEVSELPAGVYFVRILNRQTSFRVNKRVVISH